MGRGACAVRSFRCPTSGPRMPSCEWRPAASAARTTSRTRGPSPARFPLIPAREPVGVIEEIGEVAAKRWGVMRGDRVAVEALLPCGHCPECIAGRYGLCRGRGVLPAYGYISTRTPPSLWGGYAQYMYLDPHSLVHRVSPDVPPELAVLFNPLGAGFRWAVDMPGT